MIAPKAPMGFSLNSRMKKSAKKPRGFDLISLIVAVPIALLSIQPTFKVVLTNLYFRRIL